MKYLSVCSGIEAFSVAVQGLDFQPVGFSEIDPFPCAVLAHRFPDVPNLGDIHGITKENYPSLAFDLLVGGTPCQSFSIAGKREGLRGLSGLALEYVRLLREFRPTWFLWENVPGVFSSNGGEDFKIFLREIAELRAYECSWRVCDSQFFGVPQRRRRVFLVGHLGDGDYSAQVLFERESVCGDPQAGCQAGQKTPGKAGAGSRDSGSGGECELAHALLATDHLKHREDSETYIVCKPD